MEIIDLDNFMIGTLSQIFESLGKVKTGRDRFDLAWPQMTHDVYFLFKLQQQLQLQYNAVYYIFMVDL